MQIIKNQNNKSHLDVIKYQLPSHINNIINNYIEEGKNIYNNNKNTNSNIDEFPGRNELFDNWCYSIYFTCNLLYFRNIKITCFLTNKVITSVYSNLIKLSTPTLHNNIFTYYLFSEGVNSCIVFYGGTFSLPMFVYYVVKNKCFDLIYGIFGAPYSRNECYKEYINIFLSKEINNIKPIVNNNPNYVISNTQKEVVLSFANIFQAGHYLWNEVSGIDILIKTNLIKNIDTLLLGHYDICDMYKIIKEFNPSCKIIDVDNHRYNNSNVYGFISGHFILNTTKKMYFKNVIPIKLNKKLVIMIIIKADRRCMHDVENVYINLISKLIENGILNPSETIILFDGLYRNNLNDFLTNFYNKFKDKYNNIVKTIIDNIHKDIECISLIGLPFSETLRYYNSINFWIGTQSSTIELISHTNINGLLITSKTLTHCAQQQCCYLQERINHDITLCDYINEHDLIVVNFHDLYNKVENNIKLIKHNMLFK